MMSSHELFSSSLYGAELQMLYDLWSQKIGRHPSNKELSLLIVRGPLFGLRQPCKARLELRDDALWLLGSCPNSRGREVALRDETALLDIHGPDSWEPAFVNAELSFELDAQQLAVPYRISPHCAPLHSLATHEGFHRCVAFLASLTRAVQVLTPTPLEQIWTSLLESFSTGQPRAAIDTPVSVTPQGFFFDIVFYDETPHVLRIQATNLAVPYSHDALNFSKSESKTYCAVSARMLENALLMWLVRQTLFGVEKCPRHQDMATIYEAVTWRKGSSQAEAQAAFLSETACIDLARSQAPRTQEIPAAYHALLTWHQQEQVRLLQC